MSKSPTEDFGAPRVRAVGAKARDIRRYLEEAQRRARARAARPHLLPEVHPDVALAILDLILTRVSDPRFSEQLGTTRREAIRTAIDIWARGSLRNRGKLTALPRRA